MVTNREKTKKIEIYLVKTSTKLFESVKRLQSLQYYLGTIKRLNCFFTFLKIVKFTIVDVAASSFSQVGNYWREFYNSSDILKMTCKKVTSATIRIQEFAKIANCFHYLLKNHFEIFFPHREILNSYLRMQEICIQIAKLPSLCDKSTRGIFCEFI